MMMRGGPILIIDDDLDDQELLEETFSSLEYPNQVIFFTNGNDALEYLEKADTQPALVISDVNMPEISGFELKKKINRSKVIQHGQIPFIFLTTSAERGTVTDAFSLSDQGFFTKPNSMECLRNTIKTIVEYWLNCCTPGAYTKKSEDKSSKSAR
jgi:CheY-like chemotaxis protein